tara:strand:+ start:1115 stop:1690 length:576 start_codon:yes stop_codon:yes gene_type:complete
VLGNGTSRSTIPLDTLSNTGTVYGCNALYRDYIPDYLIAVDSKMVLEINRNKIQYKTSVWTNPNKVFASLSNLNYFNPSKGWSSGPTALWKASEDTPHDTIYILGFDYKGIGQENAIVNNVYSGTENYKRTQDRATFYGNWLKQTVYTIQKNSKKRYIRVLEDNGFTPLEFNKLKNLEHISIDDFKEMFIT